MPLPSDDAAALDRFWMRAWPAEAVVERHGWLLRLDRGASRRANSVLPLAEVEGEPPLDERLAEVEEIYRARGLRPCFHMTPATVESGLDAALAARGWAVEGRSEVRAADLHDVPAAGGDAEVQVFRTVEDAWLEACYDPQERSARGAIVRRIALETRFILLTVGGDPAATGGVAFDATTAGLFSMHTRPAFRGRGLAKAVVAALMREAAAAGVTRATLQVEADNTPALRLYAGLAFRPLYPYHYRVLLRGPVETFVET